jgi:Flp pilus assembly pilin Flp
MIHKANELLLELKNRFQELKEERGQTSSEYVAVTAVAVAIAISVIYATLGGALSAAVGDIGAEITAFVADPGPTTPPPAPSP